MPWAAAALSLDSPRSFAATGPTSTPRRDGRRDGESEEASRVPSRRRARVFHHEDSDALSAARALVAYDAIGDPRDAHAFCVEHRLHGKTMRRCRISDDSSFGSWRRRHRRWRWVPPPPPTSSHRRRGRRRRRRRRRQRAEGARPGAHRDGGANATSPRRRKPLAVGRAVGSRVGGVGGAFAGRRRASTRASRRLGGSRRAPREGGGGGGGGGTRRGRG